MESSTRKAFNIILISITFLRLWSGFAAITHSYTHFGLSFSNVVPMWCSSLWALFLAWVLSLSFVLLLFFHCRRVHRRIEYIDFVFHWSKHRTASDHWWGYCTGWEDAQIPYILTIGYINRIPFDFIYLAMMLWHLAGVRSLFKAHFQSIII